MHTQCVLLSSPESRAALSLAPAMTINYRGSSSLLVVLVKHPVWGIHQNIIRRSCGDQRARERERVWSGRGRVSQLWSIKCEHIINSRRRCAARGISVCIIRRVQTLDNQHTKKREHSRSRAYLCCAIARMVYQYVDYINVNMLNEPHPQQYSIYTAHPQRQQNTINKFPCTRHKLHTLGGLGINKNQHTIGNLQAVRTSVRAHE